MHVFSSTLNHRLKVRRKPDSSSHTVWNNYIKYLLSIWGYQLLCGQVTQEKSCRKQSTGKDGRTQASFSEEENRELSFNGKIRIWQTGWGRHPRESELKQCRGRKLELLWVMVITRSTGSGAGNKAVSGRQVRRADVAQVWHRDGFRVQVRCLYSVLMKLKIYQYHYDSIRDAPEDKHWWRQAKRKKGKGTRDQTGH